MAEELVGAATGARLGGHRTATGRDTAPPPPNPRRRQALALLLIGPFLSLFDQFCVNLAAPSVGESFRLTPFEFQAVVGGYGLVYGLGLITGGRLGDLFGRRRMYRAGIAVFALTSLVCALAWSPGSLIAARLAQGAAAAMLQPQVLALIRTQFPPGEQQKALSWFAVSMSLGMVCGQVLGGALPAWDLFGLGWRTVFLVAVPLCLAAFLLLPATLDADRPALSGQGVDVTGAVLGALSVACVLLPLAAAGEWPFLPTGLAVCAAGYLLGTVFVRHQRARAREGRPALLPLGLFSVPVFAYGVLLNFLLYTATVPFAVVLALYLQDEAGLSSAEAGLAFTPAAVAIAVGSRIAVPLRARFGDGVLVSSAALIALGLAAAPAAAALGGGGASLALLLAGMAVYGVGNGMIVPLLTGAVMSRVPPRDAGAGAGVLATTQQLAAALGIALVGIVLYPPSAELPLRYPAAMAAGVAVAVLAVVAAARLAAVARQPTADGASG
ncbi:MFS transporter [Streptomyces tirandamycinicus]|uniref:MFS transporter n=1 Tax=Streptomyces tirandamycinicus TaxID=2174846 RepID=A0A2S1T278_9ACTN|nr:MFS transporter [Streptomyces tirandamycinicus]AWI32783.1 MFS transporter [Streptomyces tirandamycinicus]